ncbi:ferric reductase transmembrane component 3 [Pseudovirgaria hyperparasitica]|uniref:Ferric reductase transmembrane component 3 n=1 Tax=Pseudovirgaria hyperparasitica TaxID=470096 RepID=A0A6A6VSE6_9PEZI|nr:ferric reductase transmembrane component 3 [Pseudovirgaria hyperparasitica]KAF2752706.1 ferric reductase transmembrane component 3 [Pseudovirgaria hyperparasitica]
MELQSADFTFWYSIVLGGAIAVILATSLCLSVVRSLYPRPVARWFRRACHKTGQVIRLLHSIPHSHATVLVLLFLINVLSTAVHVHGYSDVSRRTARMSVINVACLAMGARMNAVADLALVPLPLYFRVHYLLGVLAILEAAIHAGIALALQTHPMNQAPNVAPLTATAGMALLLLSSVGPIRVYFYEWFMKAHVVLFLAVCIAVRVHLNNSEYHKPPLLYLVVAAGIYLSVNMMRLAYALYRNVARGGAKPCATMHEVVYHRTGHNDILLTDTVQLHICLARSWKPRAGQYVYITVPSASSLAFLESHPFYIYQTLQEHDKTIITIIAQRRKGFTRQLSRPQLKAAVGYSAIVEGPFGRELDLSGYGTVLLFATGTGIIGQIGYVAQLLDNYDAHDAKARGVKLFWQMDCELHMAWVQETMQSLLARDRDLILNIQLFVCGEFLSRKTVKGDIKRLGLRITQTFCAMDTPCVIAHELHERKGRTIVSLCVDKLTNQAIRRAVCQEADRGVVVEELDFRPYQSVRKHTARKTGSDQKDRGQAV